MMGVNDRQALFFGKLSDICLLQMAFLKGRLDTNVRKKKKYLIGKPGEGLFAFAGLCDQWANPDIGELIRTAAIVITQAKGIMQEIQNSKVRMPEVLSESEESDWLSGFSVRSEIAFEATFI